MKMIPLVCPYCGKEFYAYSERQTVVCTHCRRKCAHEDGRISIIEYSEPSDIHEARKVILGSSPEDAVNLCHRLIDEDDSNPHGWLLRGFAQLCTYDLMGERTEPSVGTRRAFASWKNAMLRLGSDYLFDDFIQLIGASFARRDLMGLPPCPTMGAEMEQLAYVLDREFGFDSRLVIWHLIRKGYSECMRHLGDPEEGNDAALQEIARESVFFEADYAELISSCRRMAEMSERRHGNDAQLLRLIADTCERRAKMLLPGERTKIMSAWDSRGIEFNLTDAWNDVLRANGEELPDLFSSFLTRKPKEMSIEEAVDNYIIQFLHPM
ncbi:hypothetical protein TALC_00638 [Thermoplasmatales archaeon BRNA1]|nr:hypothetical protein TALC_00638 [Thermoplasmatales archaeon BRNA1]